MSRIENDDELPEVPDGKVRVIDDADLEYITLTGEGFEAVMTVNDWHLEDEEEFDQ